MKEYLREHQPLFYNLIYNEFSQNKIPHAFLLVGNNTEKPLIFLAMSLICDQTLACMQCNDCRKVAQNKYGDISGFYIADSNRGTVFYPAWRIREAIRPFVGVNVTNQIIR